MRLHRYFIALLSVVTAVAAQDEEDPDPPAPTPTGIDTFANVTAYQPDDDSTQLTAVRTETLPNNTVLAAWSESSSVGNISIYRSTNNGYSWYPFGSAKSNSKKKLLQPHLLYVNGSYGEDENVVLLAVNAVDDKSTAIELFVSNDLGKTFELVSEVAKGGPLSNIATAVANPFLLLNGDSLSLFYAGKGDKTHAQKVVQQTTTDDYESWGTSTDIVASKLATDEPSSPSIAKVGRNKYIIAFQYGVVDAATNKTTYPIYYKITSNPQRAGNDPTREISVNTKAVPRGVPSVAWTPIGGVNGTIVLSDSASTSVFINRNLGEGTWEEVPTPAGRALAREVRVPPNDQTKVRFAGGSEQGQRRNNQILFTVMDLGKVLASG